MKDNIFEESAAFLDNDGKLYKMGQQNAAKEILEYIKFVCFSRDEKMVTFRVNSGCKGVIEVIMSFISATYLTEGNKI